MRNGVLKFCRVGLRLCVVWLMCSLMACATAPYRPGTGREAIDAGKYPPLVQQLYQGAPHKFLDASDWYWPYSLLAKLMLWDRDVDSHEISACTLAHLDAYLQFNGLDHVQVLANRYAPGNQWRRLFKNRAVGAFWRYTIGVLSVSLYTIMPGRFFGGDAFNPYTNTIYLYSDDPAIALHEAAHAKDFARRRLKGLHAAIYALPLAALYYEARASSDALSYSQHLRDTAQLKESYKLLYPAYATYAGGSLNREPALGLIAVIPGHIAGRLAAARVEPAPPDAAGSDPCAGLLDDPGTPESVAEPAR